MDNVILKNRFGNFAEIISDVDYENFLYSYETNEDRSLDFTIVKTERNSDIYDRIVPDMLIEYLDEDYTILDIEENDDKGILTKSLTAKHIYMEMQYVYIDKDLSNEVVGEDVNQDEEKTSNKIDKKKSFINPTKNEVYDFYKSKGLEDYQIFGIMGNIQQESGFDSTAEQFPNQPSNGGKGLFQWDDRKYKLYDYAEENNTSWQDTNLQLRFSWQELETTEKQALNELMKTKTVREATIAFHKYYERSADDSAGIERRVKYAEEIEKEFNKSDLGVVYANSDYIGLEKGINFGYSPNGNDPNYPFPGGHFGLDLNYVNEPVYSVVKGKAYQKSDPGGFGTYVLVHGYDGLDFYYGHLSEYRIKEGEDVEPGTLLGISGNTGKSTGPHLHFEIRQDNKPIDPLVWIENNKMKTQSDDISDNTDEDEQSIPKYSINEYLDFGFRKNPAGFSYEIHGDFPYLKPFKEIGGNNLLEHVIKGSEVFNYTYFAENKKINIYATGNFREYADTPIIYRMNTEKLNVKTDIKELETYIRGYGGKITKKDTKNYKKIKTKDLKLNGNFEKKGTYKTNTVNNYYETTFNSEWGNEKLEWKFKTGSKGGKLSVYIDGKFAGHYDSYSERAKTESVILVNGLDKGKHNIKVKLEGKSKKGDYPKEEATLYIGGENNTIFSLSAKIKGDDIYRFFAEYKSPLYDSYYYRQAPTLYEDNVETKSELKLLLQEKIKDEPIVEVSTEYNSRDDIKENSMVKLIHKPMGFNIDVSVQKLKIPHRKSSKALEVELSNSKKDMMTVQRDVVEKIRNQKME